MNTQYPNNLSKHKYTHTMILNYETQHGKYFSYNQIKEPIELLIDRIDHSLSRFKNPNYKLIAIKELENIYKNNSGQSLLSPSAVKTIFDYFAKNEEAVINYTENLCKIEFPHEHKKKYLAFLSEAAKTLLDQVCRATKEKIHLFLNDSQVNERCRPLAVSGGGDVSPHSMDIKLSSCKNSLMQPVMPRKRVQFTDNAEENRPANKKRKVTTHTAGTLH